MTFPAPQIRSHHMTFPEPQIQNSPHDLPGAADSKNTDMGSGDGMRLWIRFQKYCIHNDIRIYPGTFSLSHLTYPKRHLNLIFLEEPNVKTEKKKREIRFDRAPEVENPMKTNDNWKKFHSKFKRFKQVTDRLFEENPNGMWLFEGENGWPCEETEGLTVKDGDLKGAEGGLAKRKREEFSEATEDGPLSKVGKESSVFDFISANPGREGIFCYATIAEWKKPRVERLGCLCDARCENTNEACWLK